MKAEVLIEGCLAFDVRSVYVTVYRAQGFLLGYGFEYAAMATYIARVPNLIAGVEVGPQLGVEPAVGI